MLEIIKKSITQNIRKKIILFRLFLKTQILRSLVFLFFRKRDMKGFPKSIILFRTCLLGDFLFAIPTISILRKNFPNTKIVLMTSFAASKKTVLGGAKYVDKDSIALPLFKFIYPSLVDEIVYLPNFSISTLKQVRHKVKELNPDLFFLLYHPGDLLLGIIKKIVLFKIIGVKKNFYGYKVKRDYSYGTDIQHELGLIIHKIEGPLEAIREYDKFNNLDFSTIDFPLEISNDAFNWAREKLNVPSKTLIVSLAIGSIQPHKRWPIEKFGELAIKILSCANVKFVLIGTNGDKDLGTYLEAILGSHQINLIGKTDVEQLAAILKQSDILIGNDGGAVQLGAAVKTNTISIIPGLEYPNSIEPWGYFDNVVRHPVECAPCYNMTECPLGHNKCMTDLPVDQVFKQFIKLKEKIQKRDYERV